MTRKKIEIQRRAGGKGQKFSDRNADLVLLRQLDPKKYSYGKLGEIFRINKKVAEEIYKRERRRLGGRRNPIIMQINKRNG